MKAYVFEYFGEMIMISSPHIPSNLRSSYSQILKKSRVYDFSLILISWLYSKLECVWPCENESLHSPLFCYQKVIFLMSNQQQNAEGMIRILCPSDFSLCFVSLLEPFFFLIMLRKLTFLLLISIFLLFHIFVVCYCRTLNCYLQELAE